MRLGNLASHKRTGEETKKCTDRNGEENVCYHMKKEVESHKDKRTNKD